MAAAIGGDAHPPSGNQAFDEYKADTLKRLRGRAAGIPGVSPALAGSLRDRAEFDQFMSERRNRPDSRKPRTQVWITRADYSGHRNSEPSRLARGGRLIFLPPAPWQAGESLLHHAISAPKRGLHAPLD